ncbi:MAG: DUF4388 domain-containing protein [Deltaproteobacteria bacterium]|nr:DUF4388 domain-containing protein [Deltaproteobacteria bacterium]
MALSGTLKDFGISDIFQLIGQQQKTGVLHLTEKDEEVHVAFKDGNIVRAECATRKRKELLGDMLVRAGLVSERQLQEALEDQKRTLKRLGDILVARGSVERSALREMAQLQTCETIYRLFNWKSGDYAFETAEVEYDPETVTPIRSESVLMEGFRRVDEWPLLRKRIPNLAMTFQRAKDLPERSARAKPDEVDAAFEAFDGGGGADQKDQAGSDSESIGANERRVYKLADPGRDVAWIVDRSRLGEFETCKSLVSLINGGFLSPLAAKARKKDTPSDTRGRRVVEFLVASTGKLAAAVVLLAAVGLVAVTAPISPLASTRADERPVADPSIERVASRSQMARIHLALSVFVLVRGESPQSLAELVAAGILTEGEVRYPWRDSYYYRKTGEISWVLLPPL